MDKLNGILDQQFARHKCCVIIPTYNNQATIAHVISESLVYTSHVIVVNDGSTDGTDGILREFGNKIHVIRHPQNLGKGMALRNGFAEALGKGYDHAITIDSDGQHFPSDFSIFLEKLDHDKDVLIIGARNMRSENVPGGSSFGNKFSNFWFKVETGISLPDTQSGYRAYPIRKMEKMRFFSSRFEFEIEVIVKAAWKGIRVISVPVKVFYAKQGERVSHFRPTRDFARISLLNTYLVLLAFAWYKPMRFFRGFTPKNMRSFFRKHFLNKEESPIKKAASVATGIFFGIVPIWGYQLVSAIAAAYLLKLNKAIVILTANISIPPLLPFVLIASLRTGELITGEEADLSIKNISLDTIQLNLKTYLTGACILAAGLAIISGLLTYLILIASASGKSRANK